MQILLFWIFRGVQNYVTIYFSTSKQSFLWVDQLKSFCEFVSVRDNSVKIFVFYPRESKHKQEFSTFTWKKNYYKNHLKNIVFMKYHLFTKILPHHENIQLFVNINFLPWLKCFFLCDCHEQKTKNNLKVSMNKTCFIIYDGQICITIVCIAFC